MFTTTRFHKDPLFLRKLKTVFPLLLVTLSVHYYFVYILQNVALWVRPGGEMVYDCVWYDDWLICHEQSNLVHKESYHLRLPLRTHQHFSMNLPLSYTAVCSPWRSLTLMHETRG